MSFKVSPSVYVQEYDSIWIPVLSQFPPPPKEWKIGDYCVKTNKGVQYPDIWLYKVVDIPYNTHQQKYFLSIVDIADNRKRVSSGWGLTQLRHLTNLELEYYAVEILLDEMIRE